MKAVLCTTYGTVDDLEVKEIDDPAPGAHEVRVRMSRVAVNFPDSLIIAGLYQIKPTPPFSPGGEGVGRIETVGEGVSESRVGERVMVWDSHNCMAEKVVVHENKAFPVPEALSDDSAASLMFGHGTSYYALKQRGGLAAGETLMVFGAAGGVGLAAVQLGKAMGAKVIAVVSTQEKANLVKSHGADSAIVTAEQDVRAEVKSLTAHQGVDVVYDPVGGGLSELGVRSMAWGGRLLVIGFAAGDIPSIPLNLVLLKSCSITGVFWGAFAAREPGAFRQNVVELLEMAATEKIAPHIGARFSLDEGPEAIRVLAERRALGKVLVEVD
ncbi:MAG: NADPH:quinone oxidoreductase family protein [Myxococcota bacterium]